LLASAWRRQPAGRGGLLALSMFLSVDSLKPDRTVEFYMSFVSTAPAGPFSFLASLSPLVLTILVPAILVPTRAFFGPFWALVWAVVRC
jgi:hypothetical protein